MAPKDVSWERSAVRLLLERYSSDPHVAEVDYVWVVEHVLRESGLSVSEDLLLVLLLRLTSLLERQQDLQGEAVVEDVMARLDGEVEAWVSERSGEPGFQGEREPDDPLVVERMLPEDLREQFLAEYRDALRAAYPPGGYVNLRIMLRRWRMAAEVAASAAYQHEEDRSRQAAETGDFTGYVPWEQVSGTDWRERAQARRTAR